MKNEETTLASAFHVHRSEFSYLQSFPSKYLQLLSPDFTFQVLIIGI